jgi:hypothetical protein
MRDIIRGIRFLGGPILSRRPLPFLVAAFFSPTLKNEIAKPKGLGSNRMGNIFKAGSKVLMDGGMYLG